MWTAADQAELDVLAHYLAHDYYDHRDRCAYCSSHTPCPQLTKAIDSVVQWLNGRILLSRAEALRAEHRHAA